MVFKIKYKDKKTSARVGVLETKNGKIKTPFFMPVATKATAKFLNTKQLEELSAKAIISNAFILSIRPGAGTIKKLGGIKKFMNFNGINATDSGGFQMYSDSLYLKSGDTGVWFRNPVSGEKIFMTPEKNMEIQLDIGADVAMCLDSMPLHKESKDSIKKAVERTIKWAGRCKKEHDRLQSKIVKGGKQLLFCISQGGIYRDLREKCARELLEYDFDGYAIGGIALPENCYRGDINKVKKQEHEIILTHKKIIPKDKICYVMGEGEPVWMLEAIALGVDMFDSRYPTQAGRRGTLLTSKGELKILNKKFEMDAGPIDSKCSCFVCKNYSRAYIRFLLKEGESIGKELASYHNLYYLQKLMVKSQEAIKDGKFEEFKEKVKKKYQKDL